MRVLSLHMFFLHPRPLTMYIHYCDSESPGSVGIVKKKCASLPERLHFLRSIRMCGEAHKGTLLIIITVSQPLVVLGHVTEGPCDKWKMTTLK